MTTKAPERKSAPTANGFAVEADLEEPVEEEPSLKRPEGASQKEAMKPQRNGELKNSRGDR